MPGYDRTGPGGQGSQTGRRLGKCSTNKQTPNGQVTTEEVPIRSRQGGSGQGRAQRMSAHKVQGGRRGRGRRLGNTNA